MIIKTLYFTSLILATNSNHHISHAFQSPHTSLTNSRDCKSFPIVYAAKTAGSDDSSSQKKSKSSKPYILKEKAQTASSRKKKDEIKGKNTAIGSGVAGKGINDFFKRQPPSDGVSNQKKKKEEVTSTSSSQSQPFASFFTSLKPNGEAVNGQSPRGSDGKKENNTPTIGSFFQAKKATNESQVNGSAIKSKSKGNDGKKENELNLGNFFQSPKLNREAEIKEDQKDTSSGNKPNNFFSAFTAPSTTSNVSPVTTKEEGTKTPVEKLKALDSNQAVSGATNASNFLGQIFGASKETNNVKVKLRPGEEVITNDITGFTTTIINVDPRSKDPELRNKFSFAQRIESVKTGVVGLLAGGVSLTPFSAFHNLLFADDSIANELAQWEYDTDTGSIAAALFAIVYRYCVRDGEEKNEMLQMGVIGAFVVVRTLARIRVPIYCSAIPLDCGEPFGYFDYSMIQQGIGSGLESVVMFGVTALAVEYCYEQGYITRFK